MNAELRRYNTITKPVILEKLKVKIKFNYKGISRRKKIRGKYISDIGRGPTMKCTYGNISSSDINVET